MAGRWENIERSIYLILRLRADSVLKKSDTLTAGNSIYVFDTEFGRFGLEICYDIRFPEFAKADCVRRSENNL